MKRLYKNQQYERALEHFSDYWGFDLSSADLRSKFNFETVFERMDADKDSAEYDAIMEYSFTELSCNGDKKLS